MSANDLGDRISQLEEQVNSLFQEKRSLEERIRDLERPRKYVATLKELYWIEVQQHKNGE
jgi:exonuclease VII small subunit